MALGRVATIGLSCVLIGLTGCSWLGGGNPHAPPPQAAAPMPDLSTAIPAGTTLDDRFNAMQAELDQIRTLQQEQQLLQQQNQEIQQLQKMQIQQQQQIQQMVQQNAQGGAMTPGAAPANTATASAAPAQRKAGGVATYAPAFGWWHPGDPTNPSDYDKWDDESSREGNGDARNY